MIWHIFRKDWKLLWPFVTLVAAMQCVNAVAWLRIDPLDSRIGPNELITLALTATFLMFIGVAVLTFMAVHQDRIPGDRQDWLIRPISGRDLMSAKLLFIVIAVHGPMFLANLGEAVFTGFTFWDSLSAALWRGGYVLLALTLPMFAIAAITSTLVEFVAGALAIGLVFLAVFFGGAVFFAGPTGLQIGGIGWITGMWGGLWLAIMLAAAIVIVPLQYLRRATVRARCIALGAVLLAETVAFLPWAPAYSIQQTLSADRAAGQKVAVAFDPGVGRSAGEASRSSEIHALWLPVRVSGLGPDTLLYRDLTAIRIIGSDGEILSHGLAVSDDPQQRVGGGFNLPRDDFPVRPAAAGNATAHQLIILPTTVYERLRSQPVRVELDYSLTLFRADATDRIKALNGDVQTAAFGRCRTRIEEDGGQIRLACLKTGSGPGCTTLTLENPLNGLRNTTIDHCYAEYWPFAAHVSHYLLTFIEGKTSRYQEVRFRDPEGLVKYAVDSTQVANAQVILKAYRPVAHFTRQLVIPAIRLGDWEAAAPKIAANTTPQHNP